MAEHTKIEWCDHTWNPWIGCTKVSLGCDDCYAERATPTRVLRARGLETWGKGGARYRTNTWGDPLRWNKRHAAFYAEHGRRQRVFCASLADVFDNQVDPTWRADLFRLIENTPHLDWLLLTKRIGNAAEMAFLARGGHLPLLPNLWLGATVVNQAEADRDIPKLPATPAAVRFLSIEPMLGAISFEGLFATGRINDGTNALEALDWVICGGESGPKARPMHPDWARSLRDQCEAAGVPFLFKQWGEWFPDPDDDRGAICKGITRAGELLETNAEFNARAGDAELMFRVGKKAAGRLLEGRTHDGFPMGAAP